MLGLKGLAINRWGNEVQREQFIDEAGRMGAGTNSQLLADVELNIAYRDAVAAQRRLARMNEQLATVAAQIAVTEDKERQENRQ